MATDGTPRFAASRLGLICFHMPHKKDARLIWVNSFNWNELFNNHVRYGISNLLNVLIRRHFIEKWHHIKSRNVVKLTKQFKENMTL